MNATDSLSAWLAYIEQQHPSAIAMGLERVREVAVRLQIAAPAKHVIVVGGTNGKGSTVAFIEAIGRAAGWKVGAYTSPHLLRYNERVRIDGQEASDAQLVDAFAAVEAARGDTALTYFEFGTLAALWLFQQSALELAVLEIGLGGRLDAVNIVDSDVAVITTVDLDHTDWLGDDREAIGAEKAGIIRAWKPVVLGEIDPPSSVLRRAYQLGANAIRAGSDYFFEPIDTQHAESPQSDAPRWRWRDVAVTLELPMPALHAPVQLANAAAAIAALQALPVEVPDAAWAQGIGNAQVAGRLQRLEVDGVQVLLDVGHNPQAARALAAALDAQAASCLLVTARRRGTPKAVTRARSIFRSRRSAKARRAHWANGCTRCRSTARWHRRCRARRLLPRPRWALRVKRCCRPMPTCRKLRTANGRACWPARSTTRIPHVCAPGAKSPIPC